MATTSFEITRRELLLGGGVLLAGLASPLAWPRRAHAEAYALPKATREALASSPLVYISPLHRDGSESTCHGEVWFFEDRGDVVMAAANDSWKVRAIESGRDRARIWVGDFGPVARSGGAYRSAPGFLARARVDREEAVFARLLDAYGKRYPEAWSKWKPRFERGYESNERRVLRYEPIGA